MSNITVLIPIVAIPTHPSGEVLDETIDSIRERLPDSEIILMFDGVPSQLMHLKTQYDEYTRQMLWRINNEMKNVVPLVFTEHHHQNLMTKEALKMVRTPLILWSEQDTPLIGDIPFEKLSEVLQAGYANSIRFHHEAEIHPEHKYLMLEDKPIDIMGLPFHRSLQWSGRPHLTTTEFYTTISDKYFGDTPAFIEHIMYGKVAHGEYSEFKLHIYAPDGGFVRSLHLDGRRRGAAEYDPSPS